MKTLKRILTLFLISIFPIFLSNCEKEETIQGKYEVTDLGSLKSLSVDENSVTVFGPEEFIRAEGSPELITREVLIGDYDCYEELYEVIIQVGDAGGDYSISNAEVIINGEVIWGVSDFNNKSALLSVSMMLPPSFTLEMILKGKPGDMMSLWINGTNKCSQCGETFVDDRDGQEYNTVQIGDQCWMAENLRATHFADGTAIPYVESEEDWGALGIDDKAYSWYKNDEANKEIWGGLYNWAAASNGASGTSNIQVGQQGVCPDGWHLPSDYEWMELETYLGMNSEELDITGWRGTTEGGDLKAITIPTWWSPNIGATNSTGFTALLGGYRYPSGPFNYSEYFTGFWTYTDGACSGGCAVHRFLGTNYSTIDRHWHDKNHGYSVRCVKDE